MSILDTWNEWDMNKKAIVIIVAFFILAAILLLALGGIGSGAQLKVNYDGQWQGIVQNDDTVKVIVGHGDQIIDLDFNGSEKINVQVSKQDGSSDVLNVQVVKHGEVVQEQSSFLPYGFVSFIVKP